jgi:hypothetical protein
MALSKHIEIRSETSCTLSNIGAIRPIFPEIRHITHRPSGDYLAFIVRCGVRPESAPAFKLPGCESQPIAFPANRIQNVPRCRRGHALVTDPLHLAFGPSPTGKASRNLTRIRPATILSLGRAWRALPPGPAECRCGSTWPMAATPFCRFPMVNILSGGLHAGSHIEFQDFLVGAAGAGNVD